MNIRLTELQMNDHNVALIFFFKGQYVALYSPNLPKMNYYFF